MPFSPECQELIRLIQERRGPDGDKYDQIPAILQERPDLIKAMGEYCRYAEEVEERQATSNVGHSLGQAMAEMFKTQG